MAVNALTGVNNSQQSQSIKNADAKLQAAIASIVSGTTSDVTNVAIASELQSQTTGLKQISNNLVQGFSLTQVADGGAAQIQNSLTQLQSLAQQAQSPTVNAETRKQLNQQFQQIINQVDQLASGTSFNGNSLLDGSLSGSNSLSLDTLLSSSNAGGNDLSIANLTSGALFGGQSLNILSSDSASQASGSINSAIGQLTSARASIGAFQRTLDFASANIDSAIGNQQAALSTFSETDLAAASTQSSQAELQSNASIALAAQGNRLNPALLKLIG